MIQRCTLNKSPRRSIDEFISRFEIYAIESLADSLTRYAASETEFAIMRQQDAMTCDIDEMPRLAEMFRPAIRQEILDLYEDLKDLKRMDIEYGAPSFGRLKEDMEETCRIS